MTADRGKEGKPQARALSLHTVLSKCKRDHCKTLIHPCRGGYVRLRSSGFSIMRTYSIRSNKTKTKPLICFMWIIHSIVRCKSSNGTLPISEQCPSHKGGNRFVYTTNCISNVCNLKLEKVILPTITYIYILIDR